MQAQTAPTLETRSDNEISFLCAAYVRAMAATEPYSPDWRFAQWGFEQTMRERRRRLHSPAARLCR